MSGELHVPPDMLVLRFSPTQPEALVRKAEQEFRRVGHYGLSVFAAAPVAAESEDALVQRLLEASKLAGIRPGPKFYTCLRAGNLLDAGFVFIKDEDPNEVPEHYCVNLGTSALSVVQAFLAAFVERRR